MRITHVEAIPFNLPTRLDFKWASLQVGLGSFVLVRLHTDEGMVGLGEATPLPDWGGDYDRHGGETQLTVCHMVEDVMGPALIGLDPSMITSAHALMGSVVKGHTYAKNAIEMALHDISAKRAGLPLYRMLGGQVRDQVAIAHMVGLMEFEAAVEEAKAAVEEGISALQIKGGVDPERDVELATKIRTEVGDEVVLRLDANQGYPDVKTAISVITEMGRQGIDFVEQPVTGISRMSEVRANVPVRIIADESCWDPSEALEVASQGGADVISIYLAKAGGIGQARKVAAIAEAAGLQCDVNGSIESGIGNAANLAFAVSTPVVQIPSVIPITTPSGGLNRKVGGLYYTDDIVTQAFEFESGGLLPLEAPGLGVEVDENKLSKFRVD